jgi:hypothetical protein
MLKRLVEELPDDQVPEVIADVPQASGPGEGSSVAPGVLRDRRG